jgi:predicted small lipoprotein YifL
MKRMLLAAVATLALAGSLAACQTATPYQPLSAKNADAGGYSDTRLDRDHWRVAFSGNTLTSRETVERYLLFRAAELTTSQGFDWFMTADKHTDKKSEAFVDPIYGYGWSPNWRFYGGGRWGPYGAWGGAWGGPWGPGWGGPWGSPYGPATIDEFNKYEVSAEIIMGHGPRPATGGALDAHEVMMNLGPQIQRPKA